ncbi:hypothetical protein BJV77DRAFT_991215 [Russula vinacea]|nr:hypothetical protein BJV77DRAFT_991215 [Russula vinacea]
MERRSARLWLGSTYLFVSYLSLSLSPSPSYPIDILLFLYCVHRLFFAAVLTFIPMKPPRTVHILCSLLTAKHHVFRPLYRTTSNASNL